MKIRLVVNVVNETTMSRPDACRYYGALAGATAGVFGTGRDLDLQSLMGAPVQ